MSTIHYILFILLVYSIYLNVKNKYKVPKFQFSMFINYIMNNKIIILLLFFYGILISYGFLYISDFDLKNILDLLCYVLFKLPFIVYGGDKLIQYKNKPIINWSYNTTGIISNFSPYKLLFIILICILRWFLFEDTNLLIDDTVIIISMGIGIPGSSTNTGASTNASTSINTNTGTSISTNTVQTGINASSNTYTRIPISSMMNEVSPVSPKDFIIDASKSLFEQKQELSSYLKDQVSILQKKINTDVKITEKRTPTMFDLELEQTSSIHMFINKNINGLPKYDYTSLDYILKQLLPINSFEIDTNKPYAEQLQDVINLISHQRELKLAEWKTDNVKSKAPNLKDLGYDRRYSKLTGFLEDNLDKVKYDIIKSSNILQELEKKLTNSSVQAGSSTQTGSSIEHKFINYYSNNKK